jgi:hypothetical protein
LVGEREKAQTQFKEVADMAENTISDNTKDRTVEEVHKSTRDQGTISDVEQYDAALILLSIRKEDRREGRCMNEDPEKVQDEQKTHNQTS